MSLLLKNVVALDGFLPRARVCDLMIEEGRIASILSSGQGEGDEIFDGKGKVAVIPGLVNTHTHAAMTLLRGLGEELPLQEWLNEKMWPVEARLDAEKVYWGTRLALLEMAAAGTTCFADMYFFMEDVARASHETGMRCGLSRGLIGDDMKRLEENLDLADRWHGKDGLVRVQIGPHAPYTVPPKMLETVAATAREKGLGVHVHWLETEWEVGYIRDELGKDPVDLIFETGLGDVSSLILAHGVWFPEERLGDIARDNLTVVHNPSSNMKLGSGIAPVSEMLQAGVHVALGTDGAASNNRLDMWQEMRETALLHKGWKKDPTVVTAREVLRMATWEGARALGFSEVGALREGWQADLALIDLDRPEFMGWDVENLAHFLVYAGNASQVLGTLTAGKWLYRKGEFPGQDREAVLREASRCRRELVS